MLAMAAAACVKEAPVQVPGNEVVITATATLPGGETKMIYEDHVKDGEGVKAGWQTGDTFLALEVNGSTVTPVTFTATAPADVKTSFTSSGAVAADANTQWVAVLGKGAGFENGLIKCTYTSQDGSVKGLEGVDYMTAAATGETPDFNYAEGRHLSYLLRIAAPEGVGAVEFNSCEGSEWTVASDGTVTGNTPDYRPKAVKSFKMKKETKAGDMLYLAVPAFNYSDAGLIVTVLSSDGKKSQGKVAAGNFSDKGGKLGSYDMTDPLIDRPLPSEAIDFFTGSSVLLEHLNNTSWEGIHDTYVFDADAKWAPFNLGAKASPATAEDTYGNLFAWGETEEKEAYSWSNYKRADELGTIGYKRTMRGRADIPLEMTTISGTRYDVARVKWGKEWRLPFLEDILSLTGTNETISTSSGQRETTTRGMVTTDVTSYNGVDVAGRTFSRNGRTLFLPFSGRYYYTAGNQTSSKTYLGKTGLYYCGTKNITAGSKEAYRLMVRANQVDCDSQEAGYAFAVRPVLALESDEPAKPVKVEGRVFNANTGVGIEGVAVTDGFSFCKTGANGSYCLDADVRARNICITVPSSYRIPLGDDGRPAFYKLVKVSAYTGESIDFALEPRLETSNKFTVIAVADSHLKNGSHISRARNESFTDIQATVNELVNEGNAGEIIGIALGDQMWDCWETPGIAASVRNLYTGITNDDGTMPFFYVIGNHDHQSRTGGGEDEATALFLENFGPRDFSFDIGNAHVVVMDGIDYSGTDDGEKIKYGERITGEQLHWLKEDIEIVKDKESKIGIFCVHAPAYSALGNQDGIRTLFRQFSEAHIFSGHIHNITNKHYKGQKCKGGRDITEHNIQSLSGAWWDADMSPNGSPSGYGVYTFDGAKLVREYNKFTEENKNFQVRVYSGNDSYNGYTANSGYSSPKKNTSYGWDSQYQGKFLVRVLDGENTDITSGEETWSVSFEQNGVTKQMSRVSEMIDKCAIAYIVDIMGSPYGMKDSGASATSIGWWTIDAPGGNPATETGWKVVAKHTLPGGWSMTYTTSTLTRDYQGYFPGSHFLY